MNEQNPNTHPVPALVQQQAAQEDARTMQGATDVPAMQYKPVAQLTDSGGPEQSVPVDFRRVQHGHGPCSCCGPYSE